MSGKIGDSKQSREELAILRENKRNPRFQQLMELAKDGDAEAVGDLWREFQFAYEREGGDA